MPFPRVLANRYLVLSALAHVLFALVLYLSQLHRLDRTNVRVSQEPIVIPVVTETVDKDQKDRTQKQIAESEKVNKTERAEKDAFLSEQNQIVDRQTKARTETAFRELKKGNRGASQTAENQQKAETQPSISGLGAKFDYKPLGHLGPGQTASTSDYLKDLRPGAQTLLNTREFAYFSYYQRVRKQLEQYWEPGLRIKLRKMFSRGRTLATDREHATKLLVILNQGGEIKRVLVESTSGLMDLDDAAVEAFNKAGPFPNPPRGMTENDGTVRVEWEFILKT